MMKSAIFAMVLLAIHSFPVAFGFERKIGSERRLHGWMVSAEELEEQYLSLYCRCCGSVEDERNISAALIPDCAAYENQTCSCPVREETGSSWWNFFGSVIASSRNGGS
jgi:hypothetical protein